MFRGGGTHTAGATRGFATVRRIVFGGSAIYKRVDPSAVVRAIDIRPDTFSVPVGGSRNVFTTTAPYVPDVSIVVRDTSLAVLAPSGAVIGRRAGTTYVVASAGGLRDSARVVVRP